MPRYSAKHLIAFLLAILLSPLPSNAQSTDSYPVRLIRMIIPFAPGGSTDFVARVIQPRLSEKLGQQVVTDFRPGAAGNIGIELTARSTADGYTLTFANIGAIANR